MGPAVRCGRERDRRGEPRRRPPSARTPPRRARVAQSVVAGRRARSPRLHDRLVRPRGVSERPRAHGRTERATRREGAAGAGTGEGEDRRTFPAGSRVEVPYGLARRSPDSSRRLVKRLVKRLDRHPACASRAPVLEEARGALHLARRSARDRRTGRARPVRLPTLRVARGLARSRPRATNSRSRRGDSPSWPHAGTASSRSRRRGPLARAVARRRGRRCDGRLDAFSSEWRGVSRSAAEMAPGEATRPPRPRAGPRRARSGRTVTASADATGARGPRGEA